MGKIHHARWYALGPQVDRAFNIFFMLYSFKKWWWRSLAFKSFLARPRHIIKIQLTDESVIISSFIIIQKSTTNKLIQLTDTI